MIGDILVEDLEVEVEDIMMRLVMVLVRLLYMVFFSSLMVNFLWLSLF